MSWLRGCLRGAVAVASAGCIVGATTTADASRPRLDAWGAYWVAQGRLIAFTGVSSRDAYHSADARLWMMNADGSGRRPLRGDVLSPSGRKLAASGDTGTAGLVFVSSLSGKPIRKFTIHVPADGYGPVAWAPDERAVTVEVYAGRVMIFVADLRGGLRLVSHIRSRDDESAAWSPDGRHIAFITCRSRYPFDCHLALIGRDGSGRKVVVRRIGDANTYDVQPVWAPNGRSIAFAIRFGDTREKPATQHERAHEEQRYGIYVVKPGGTGLRRIAATPYMEMDSTDSPPLAWSPDSRRIAFVDTRGITIADIVDGSLRRLTALPRTLRTDNYVSWAPSTRVLFSHRESLYTVLPGRRPLRVLP